MKRFWSALGTVIFCAALAYGATDATISGVVKDPAGAPFRGAFVHAQNVQSKITVNVLSDNQGRYRIQNLPPGEYQVGVTAAGIQGRSARRCEIGGGRILLARFRAATGCFPLERSFPVSGQHADARRKRQGNPDGKLFCLPRIPNPHGRREARPRRLDAAVNYMLTTRHARLGNHFNDEDAAVLTNYLDDAFGVEAKLPKSPVDMPGYKATVRPVSDEGLKITYFEYDMPGPNRMPFSAAPDKDGKLWIPDMGSANTIGWLDPKTGAIQEFTAPNSFAAGIHSAVPAPDGSVWFSEQAANKVGRWDPKTKLITEYQDTYKPGMQGFEDGGSKHTVRVDSKGRVWGTAVFNNLTVYDPKNNEFSHFADTFSPYGVELDKSGNVWFAEFYPEGKIGMVDANTGKVTKWAPPSKGGWPRRIEIDDDGIVWYAEYRGGKIGRFDPKTQDVQGIRIARTESDSLRPGDRPQSQHLVLVR